MKTTLLPRSILAHAFVVLFGLAASSRPAMAQDDGTVPSIPLISIRATVPETREPFCDPAICDAALPQPGVLVLTRRGGDLATELTVFLEYGGTALNGKDYTELPTFVQFQAGSATVELLVEATYDQLPEGDEAAVAHLQPDPSLGPIERYKVDPEQALARVLIHDNETSVAPVVSIVATSPIAEETSYPYRRLPFRGRFTISRTGSTESSLTVFVLYRGTATPEVDYPALPWLVTIPAGTNRVELEVVPKPDEVPEPIEFIEAQLSECPPPFLGLPCHQLNIDPAHAMARVFLRDDGITTASLQINSPRDGAQIPAGQSIPITATAIDLEGAITHVEFFDGDRMIGESSIYFFREPDPGTPIFHEFLWREAAPGPHVLTARAIDAAGNKVISSPVRIAVAFAGPVVSIVATTPETMEPSPDTRVAPGVFTLHRTGDTANALKVWVYYGGTATLGIDYATVPNVVEFPAGADTVPILIAPLDDLLVEGDETVVAELGPSPLAIVPNYRIDPERSRAQVIIHDNDISTIPVVGIRATQPLTSEPCPECIVLPGVFSIHRSGSTAEPLAVFYEVGGTASNGTDYQRLSGEVVIPADREAVNVLILALADNVAEGEETVVVRLIVPPVASPIDPYRIHPDLAKATVVIRDYPFVPPVPIVSIAAIDALAREGTNRLGEHNPALFLITRHGNTNDPLNVRIRLSGTAENGVDYAMVSSPVTIPAGERRARVVIEPLDDLRPEGYETVIVTLLPDEASAPAYVLGDVRRAAAVIVDNDIIRLVCRRLTDGSFNVCVPVTSDGCYRLDVSRDLKEWTAVCTIPTVDGEANFVDPDAADWSHRFYRLVPVPCEP